MSRPSTESLLTELARELRPVRPIPRLGVAALAVLAAWAVAVGLSWGLGGVRPRLAEPGGLADPVFASIFAALGIAALGGVIGGLARAVPGRESLARVGMAALALGFTGVVIAAAFGSFPIEAGAAPSPSRTLGCVVHSLLLGVAPALLGFAWLARAFEPRPVLGAGVAGLAAAALGAFAVHASCITGNGLHMLVGHGLGPAAVAALIAWRASVWIAARAAST